MSKPEQVLSPALLAAQQRLLAIREKRQGERVVTGSPAGRDDHGRSPSPSSVTRVISHLPNHLGWESAAVTAVLRTSKQQVSKPASQQVSKLASQKTPPTRATPHTRKPANLQTCKLYPDVALGMLQQEQAAAGRIWLLLRHIDNVGRGWVSLEETREKLTRKESDLRVCGWRQLRNLLTKGEGVFWQRHNGRIWLRSVAKVAAALGVWRLSQRPVALPAAALRQGMGQVRAHFYASFHSGRASADKPAAPIARDTIARISCVNQRTQRQYEKRARVQTKFNFAVGPQGTEHNEQEAAWQHGRASFRLTDWQGKHGRKGATYQAWQLPNNYIGPHTQLPRGRQKRINRELADLFMKGMTGNGRNPVDDAWQPQRYFKNGRLAAKAFHKTASPIYWQNPQSRNHYQLWYILQKSGD